MREILFRAKRIDTGEWVYGYLVKRPSTIQMPGYSGPWYIKVPPKTPEDDGGMYNVDPDTVGQYTGLDDIYYYPDAQIIIVKGRGKTTNRIHAHMVSCGVPAEMIQKLWKYGSVVRSEPLREHNYYKDENGQLVDHGRDYSGLAKYLFDHWTPEQGGRRRWRQTNNLDKPVFEKPTECKREYTKEKPPMAPKGYILVDAEGPNKWGYSYFKYVKKPVKRSRVRMPRMHPRQ